MSFAAIRGGYFGYNSDETGTAGLQKYSNFIYSRYIQEDGKVVERNRNTGEVTGFGEAASTRAVELGFVATEGLMEELSTNYSNWNKNGADIDITASMSRSSDGRLDPISLNDRITVNWHSSGDAAKSLIFINTVGSISELANPFTVVIGPKRFQEIAALIGENPNASKDSAQLRQLLITAGLIKDTDRLRESGQEVSEQDALMDQAVIAVAEQIAQSEGIARDMALAIDLILAEKLANKPTDEEPVLPSLMESVEVSNYVNGYLEYKGKKYNVEGAPAAAGLVFALGQTDPSTKKKIFTGRLSHAPFGKGSYYGIAPEANDAESGLPTQLMIDNALIADSKFFNLYRTDDGEEEFVGVSINDKGQKVRHNAEFMEGRGGRTSGLGFDDPYQESFMKGIVQKLASNPKLFAPPERTLNEAVKDLFMGANAFVGLSNFEQEFESEAMRQVIIRALHDRGYINNTGTLTEKAIELTGSWQLNDLHRAVDDKEMKVFFREYANRYKIFKVLEQAQADKEAGNTQSWSIAFYADIFNIIVGQEMAKIERDVKRRDAEYGREEGEDGPKMKLEYQHIDGQYSLEVNVHVREALQAYNGVSEEEFSFVSPDAERLGLADNPKIVALLRRMVNQNYPVLVQIGHAGDAVDTEVQLSIQQAIQTMVHDLSATQLAELTETILTEKVAQLQEVWGGEVEGLSRVVENVVMEKVDGVLIPKRHEEDGPKKGQYVIDEATGQDITVYNLEVALNRSHFAEMFIDMEYEDFTITFRPEGEQGEKDVLWGPGVETIKEGPDENFLATVSGYVQTGRLENDSFQYIANIQQKYATETNTVTYQGQVVSEEVVKTDQKLHNLIAGPTGRWAFTLDGDVSNASIYGENGELALGKGIGILLPTGYKEFGMISDASGHTNNIVVTGDSRFGGPANPGDPNNFDIETFIDGVVFPEGEDEGDFSSALVGLGTRTIKEGAGEAAEEKDIQSTTALEYFGNFGFASTLWASKVHAGRSTSEDAFQGLTDSHYGKGGALKYRQAATAPGLIIMPTLPTMKKMAEVIRKTGERSYLVYTDSGDTGVVLARDWDDQAAENHTKGTRIVRSDQPGMEIFVDDPDVIARLGNRYIIATQHISATKTRQVLIPGDKWDDGDKMSRSRFNEVRGSGGVWYSDDLVIEVNGDFRWIDDDDTYYRVKVDEQGRKMSGIIEADDYQAAEGLEEDEMMMGFDFTDSDPEGYKKFRLVNKQGNETGHSMTIDVDWLQLDPVTVEIYAGKDADGNILTIKAYGVNAKELIETSRYEHDNWTDQDEISQFWGGIFKGDGWGGGDIVVRMSLGGEGDDERFGYYRIDNSHLRGRIAPSEFEGKDPQRVAKVKDVLGDSNLNVVDSDDVKTASYVAKSLESYDYNTAWYVSFTGNRPEDDMLIMYYKDGVLHSANVDFELADGFGRLFTNEIYDKDTGELLVPAGELSKANEQVKQFAFTGKAMDRAATLIGVIDVAGAIVTVVVTIISLGTLSGAAGAGVQAAAQGVKAAVGHGVRAVLMASLRLGFEFGKHMAAPYLTRQALGMFALTQAINYATTGTLSFQSAIRDFLLIGGLTRIVSAFGSVMSNMGAQSNRVVFNVLGHQMSMSRMGAQILASEALTLGVPNLISLAVDGKMLSPEMQITLAALGLVYPVSRSLATANLAPRFAYNALRAKGMVAGKALRVAALHASRTQLVPVLIRMGQSALAEGLLFGQVSAVSTAALGALQGQDDALEVMKSFVGGMKIGMVFGAIMPGLGALSYRFGANFLPASLGGKVTGELSGFAKFAERTFANPRNLKGFEQLSKMQKFGKIARFNGIRYVAPVAAMTFGLPLGKAALTTLEGGITPDSEFWSRFGENVSESYTASNMAQGLVLGLFLLPVFKTGAKAHFQKLSGAKRFAYGAAAGASANTASNLVKEFIEGHDLTAKRYAYDALTGGLLGGLTLVYLAQPKGGAQLQKFMHPSQLHSASLKGALHWITVSPSFEFFSAAWRGGIYNIVGAIENKELKQTVPWLAVEEPGEDGKLELVSLLHNKQGGFDPSRLIQAALSGPTSGMWMGPLFSVLQAKGKNDGIAKTRGQMRLARVQNLFSFNPENALTTKLSGFYRSAIYMPALVTGIHESTKLVDYLGEKGTKAASAWVGSIFGKEKTEAEAEMDRLLLAEKGERVFTDEGAAYFGWLGFLAMPSYQALPRKANLFRPSDNEGRKDVLDMTDAKAIDRAMVENLGLNWAKFSQALVDHGLGMLVGKSKVVLLGHVGAKQLSNMFGSDAKVARNAIKQATPWSSPVSNAQQSDKLQIRLYSNPDLHSTQGVDITSAVIRYDKSGKAFLVAIFDPGRVSQKNALRQLQRKVSYVQQFRSFGNPWEKQTNSMFTVNGFMVATRLAQAADYTLASIFKIAAKITNAREKKILGVPSEKQTLFQRMVNIIPLRARETALQTIVRSELSAANMGIVTSKGNNLIFKFKDGRGTIVIDKQHKDQLANIILAFNEKGIGKENPYVAGSLPGNRTGNNIVLILKNAMGQIVVDKNRAIATEMLQGKKAARIEYDPNSIVDMGASILVTLKNNLGTISLAKPRNSAIEFNAEQFVAAFVAAWNGKSLISGRVNIKNGKHTVRIEAENGRYLGLLNLGTQGKVLWQQLTQAAELRLQNRLAGKDPMKMVEPREGQVQLALLAKTGRMLGLDISKGKTLATLLAIAADMQTGKVKEGEASLWLASEQVINTFSTLGYLEFLSHTQTIGGKNLQVQVLKGPNKGIKTNSKGKEVYSPLELDTQMMDVLGLRRLNQATQIAKDGVITLTLMGSSAFQHLALAMKEGFIGAPKRKTFNAKVKRIYVDDIDQMIARPGMRIAQSANIDEILEQMGSSKRADAVANTVMQLFQQFEGALQRGDITLAHLKDVLTGKPDPVSRKIAQSKQFNKFFQTLRAQYIKNGKLIFNMQQIESFLLGTNGQGKSDYADFKAKLSKGNPNKFQDAVLIYLLVGWAQATAGGKGLKGALVAQHDFYNKYLNLDKAATYGQANYNSGSGVREFFTTIGGSKSVDLMLSARVLVEAKLAAKAMIAKGEKTGDSQLIAKGKSILEAIAKNRTGDMLRALTSTTLYDMSFAEALSGKAMVLNQDKRL